MFFFIREISENFFTLRIVLRWRRELVLSRLVACRFYVNVSRQRFPFYSSGSLIFTDSQRKLRTKSINFSTDLILIENSLENLLCSRIWSLTKLLLTSFSHLKRTNLEHLKVIRNWEVDITNSKKMSLHDQSVEWRTDKTTELSSI